MSLTLNKVFLAGNLTRDPELRQAGTSPVCSFGVALNRRWKDKASGTTKEEVTFLDVEAWGTTANLVAQYCTKGKAVVIVGRLKMDEWDDKTTGQKRSKLKVVADEVQFVGPAAEKQDAPAQATAAAAGPGAEDPF